MTSSMTASRRVAIWTSAECCVEMTTESIRTGLLFSSYSMVTWDFPSGRTKGRRALLRTEARRRVS